MMLTIILLVVFILFLFGFVYYGDEGFLLVSLFVLMILVGSIVYKLYKVNQAYNEKINQCDINNPYPKQSTVVFKPTGNLFLVVDSTTTLKEESCNYSYEGIILHNDGKVMSPIPVTANAEMLNKYE